MIVTVSGAQLVIDPKVRALCLQAYPLHPKGCPNYGKRSTCPPQVDLLGEVFDLGQTLYLVINKFELGNHVAKLSQAHPAWSERQLECCLYWQGTARAQLRKLVQGCLEEHPGAIVTTCPEAMGLNVTSTLGSLGVPIEWPPKYYALQVALVGEPKTSSPSPWAVFGDT
jgi:predicted metal-binding protein